MIFDDIQFQKFGSNISPESNQNTLSNIDWISLIVKLNDWFCCKIFYLFQFPAVRLRFLVFVVWTRRNLSELNLFLSSVNNSPFSVHKQRDYFSYVRWQNAYSILSTSKTDTALLWSGDFFILNDWLYSRSGLAD